MFKVIDARDVVQHAVFMIQKEMADRIVAKPGGKDYGALGVMIRTYADVTTVAQGRRGLVRAAAEDRLDGDQDRAARRRAARADRRRGALLARSCTPRSASAARRCAMRCARSSTDDAIDAALATTGDRRQPPRRDARHRRVRARSRAPLEHSMPELPEVETVRRTLAARGRREDRRRCGTAARACTCSASRRARSCASSSARRITAIRRHGKYLLLDTDTPRLAARPPRHDRPLADRRRRRRRARKHTHLVLWLDDGRELRFVDARRFGQIDVVARDRRARASGARRARPRSARARHRRRAALRARARPQDDAQGVRARSERARRRRQHLRERGAVAGAAAADDARAQAHRATPRAGSPRRSSRCCTTRSTTAARACATSSTPTEPRARTRIICGSTGARVSRVCAARRRSGARSTKDGQRITVQRVRPRKGLTPLGVSLRVSVARAVRPQCSTTPPTKT